jgi:hypothetical protein
VTRRKRHKPQFVEGSEPESARLRAGMANAIPARWEVILCQIYLWYTTLFGGEAFSEFVIMNKAQLEVILDYPASHLRSRSDLLGHIRSECMGVNIHWLLGWCSLGWSPLQRDGWALEGRLLYTIMGWSSCFATRSPSPLEISPWTCSLEKESANRNVYGMTPRYIVWKTRTNCEKKSVIWLLRQWD